MRIRKARQMNQDRSLTPAIFDEELKKAASICILGHTSPDGDCVGSALAIYNYIKKLRADDPPRVRVHLKDVYDKFAFLPGYDSIDDGLMDVRYELAVVCDSADISRLGKYRIYCDEADRVVMVDHHATNPGFGDRYLIVPDASSTAEVVFGLMDQSFFDRDVATCIYTGIVHDTGVFRYSSTHPATMLVAARCMEQGVDFGRVIEDSFFCMTYMQKKMLAECLINMQSVCDGKLVYSYASQELRERYGGAALDMDGMIDSIRTTTGALAAFFVYATPSGRLKASLRSNTPLIDVSAIAREFGGGGHRQAAGCFMSGDMTRDIDELKRLFEAKLREEGLIQ